MFFYKIKVLPFGWDVGPGELLIIWPSLMGGAPEKLADGDIVCPESKQYKYILIQEWNLFFKFS